MLSELLGGVGDEFKNGDPAAQVLADGSVRLPGAMAVDDAAALLDTRWDTEATSVGGLITAALGHLPVAGERATIGSYEFEVERVAHHALGSALARRVAPDATGAEE